MTSRTDPMTMYKSGDVDGVRALIKGRPPHLGVGFIRRLNRAQINCDARIYSAVIHSYIKRGKVGPVKQFYNDCKNISEEVKHTMYNGMMGGQKKAGRYQEVICLFQGMPKEQLKPDQKSYALVISACLNTDSKDQADNYLKDMLKNSLRPNPTVYLAFMDYFERKGDYKQVEHYFNRMNQDGISPNVFNCTKMMKAYTASNQPEKAVQVHQALKEPNEMSFDQLIDAYVRTDQINLAIKTSSKIKGNKHKEENGYVEFNCHKLTYGTSYVLSRQCMEKFPQSPFKVITGWGKGSRPGVPKFALRTFLLKRGYPGYKIKVPEGPKDGWFFYYPQTKK